LRSNDPALDGHGSGAVNKQTAQVTALQYAYLWMMLR